MAEKKQKVLVTGTAGFIGFHLAEKLIVDGYEVIGLDVINDYYDIELKFKRLSEHGIEARGVEKNHTIHSTRYLNYKFVRADLADHDFIVQFMVNEDFDYVVHLAAQAGVRYSIDNPRAYTHSNIDGFLSVLEGSRHAKVKHLIYASTSSVYGLNEKMPLTESDSAEHPMAFYAATKKANEMMAHSYSHLFDLPTTGLRFFTVYGPWGRPDMALFLFANAIHKGEAIKVFNHGKMVRDFTYVGDIVESISRLIPRAAECDPTWSGADANPCTSSAPYRIFNIGNNSPVKLMDYISALENAMGKEAKKNFMPLQAGDVPATHANTTSLEQWVGFKPSTSVSVGVQAFVNWLYQEDILQQ